ncbi:hypothetical protein DTO217A2_4597 [Paecilomyces variotii]|nr:hypothetical protein DTO217A2_4597 [Paecilomyces variotii]
MEQSSAQNNVPHMHPPSVTSGSVHPEYWSLYSAGPDQQQPLGSGWNHTVFQQAPQQQQQQQNHVQQIQEPNQGIYSQNPPSWHQSPSLQHHAVSQQHSISPGPQGYNIPPQYQMQPYRQEHVAYEPRSLTPSNPPAYESPYSFEPSFFQPHQVQLPETYSQPTSQSVQRQNTQPANVPSNSFRQPITQYQMHADFPENIAHSHVNFPSTSYHEQTPNLAYQTSTINPQFLTTSQQASNQAHAASHQNEFFQFTPADFERPDNTKNYEFYHHQDFQPNALNQTVQQHHEPTQQSQLDLSTQPTIPQLLQFRNITSQGDNQIPVIKQDPGVVPPVKPAKAAAPKKKKSSPTKSSQTKVKKATSKASTKKQGSKSASSSSESDSYDDSDLDIEIPEEPSPIPATRPQDPVAAAEYDTLKAVWSPRNRRPAVDTIKTALVAFKDVVKSVRDAWKEQSQAMKVAENQSDNNKAAEIKKNVTLQRRLMEVVVNTALEKGHPIIVEKLGEHPMAVAAMYSFLLDRHQASDYEGNLTVSLLKLLARFVTMDEDVLQKTNVAKLLPRFMKKGGQTVKDLAQKIIDNAAASTKRKQEAAKAPTKEQPPVKTASDTTNGTSQTEHGVKRPREGESNGLPATKRAVTPSNVKTATNTVTGASASSNATVPSKRPAEGNADAKAISAPSNGTALRPKANIVAPKPTSLFGSLASASKRPGTSNAARAAAAAKEKASAAAEKKDTPPPPPPKPTFSFGDLLADLNKPKDTASEKPTEERPPETEEERKKRLRKEERRRLRVTWKPDDSLTEIRLFTHDPEEETGRDSSSIRDVGDIKGEGRVLKEHKDLDDLEDDEEVGAKEEELQPYGGVSEIDFTVIEAEDRARNYVKRAGNLQPSSPEKQAQEHREATTLMVVHASPADIPSTPKEPPPPGDEEKAPEEVSFGELPDHVKARQARYFAMVNPQPALPPQPSVPVPAPAAPGGGLDISNLLKIIQNAPQQRPTPPPQPVQQAPLSDLEKTINLFRQQQGQPPLPQLPQFPIAQPPVSQPPASQDINLQKILAVINAQKQLQQPPALPQNQPPQPAMPSNLAAIISQFTNPAQQGFQAQPQQSSNQHYEDPERKRMREGLGYDGPSDDRYSQQKRPKMYVDPKAKKHPKAGLVACRYWREGKCLKGEDCTFRHDPLD